MPLVATLPPAHEYAATLDLQTAVGRVDALVQRGYGNVPRGPQECSISPKLERAPTVAARPRRSPVLRRTPGHGPVRRIAGRSPAGLRAHERRHDPVRPRHRP